MKYNVPKEKLGAVISAAYDLSRPQGLGFLHAKQGELSGAEVVAIIGSTTNDSDGAEVRHYDRMIPMDYVNGRAVKMTIRFDGDGWYIEGPRWYDHTEDDLLELVKVCGLVERLPA